MFLIAGGIGEFGELQEREYKINRWIFIFTIGFFIVGIISFVAFALGSVDIRLLIGEAD